jgi:hypothetical protein
MKWMRGEVLTLARTVDGSVLKLLPQKINGAKKKVEKNAAAAGTA